MGSLIVLIFLAWQILPIILIVVLIVLYSKYNRLKKKYVHISNETLSQSSPQSAATPSASYHLAQPQAAPPPGIPPVAGPIQAAVSSSVSPESLAKTKEKQTRQVINITLVIGMLFILTAGLIFATTTWNIISNQLKVICIAVFACIFFGFFGILGPWFSLQGGGRPFVFLCTMVLLLGLSIWGYRCYKAPHLYNAV